MSRQASVTGTVVDDAGVPVANASLNVSLIDQHFGNVDSMWRTPGNLNLQGNQFQFGTTTDAAGGFQIDNMPRNMRLFLVCRGPNAEFGNLILDTRELSLDITRQRDSKRSAQFERENQGVRTFPIQKSPVLFRTTRVPAVRVRVIDHIGHTLLKGRLEGAGFPVPIESETSLLMASQPGTYNIHFSPDPLSSMPRVKQQIEFTSDGIKDVTITIPITKVLTGKVIDSDTGMPVTDAWVHCIRPNVDIHEDTTKDGRVIQTESRGLTDSDGVFHLPVTEGTWRLWLSDDLPGYLVPKLAARAIMAKVVPPNVDNWKPVPHEHVDVVVTNESIPQDIVMKVGRGLVIHGTVTDQNGQPVDSAMVQVSSHPGPGQLRSYSSQSFTAHTDVNGRFTFSGVSPYVPIRISAVSATAAGEHQLEAIPDHAADMTTEKSVRIVTSPAITLTGRIVHEGKPVAGVSVRLFKQKASPPTYKWNEPDTDSPIHLAFETVTDSEGRYSVYGLQEGDRYFFDTFSHNGLVAAFWEYKHQGRHSIRAVAAGNIELPDAELVVGLGKRIPGVVIDQDGKPLPGIRIVGRLQSGQKDPAPESNRQRSRTRDASDITDDQGRFDVYLHPNQSVRLMASVHDSQTDRILYAAFENVNADDTDVRIVLDSKLGTGIEDLDAAPSLK